MPSPGSRRPAAKPPWTDEERTTLRQMWADGMGPAAIAHQLGRSKYGVARQARTLKLPAHQPQPPVMAPRLPQPRPQPLPRGARTLPPLPSEASEHPA
jgi:hypothetical protein